MITGIIMLVRSKHFLSKAIGFFMRMLARAKFHKLYKFIERYFSHVETLIYIPDVGLFTIGAIFHGTRIRFFKDAFKGRKPDELLFREPKYPEFFNERSLMDLALTYGFSEKPHGYQFSNIFISWPVYIFTYIFTLGQKPIKLFKKSEKRMYCSETGARLANVGYNTMAFPEPEITSPLDVQLNTWYKDILDTEGYYNFLMSL